MDLTEKLIDFFRREIQTEENSGFSRLERIPDSHVMAKLENYRSLSPADRLAFLDCCAHWACACYGFVVGAPKLDHTRHPFFPRWAAALNPGASSTRRSVPSFRAAVQQYKIDEHRGVDGTISRKHFEDASAVRSVKAPELRKRVRATLKPLGYYKIDDLGYYCCRQDSREFRVHVDFGSRSAQLRYCVALPEFPEVHPLLQFRFERALGFGNGDWDYIVEENVDDVFLIFAEVVNYCGELPARIRAAI